MRNILLLLAIAVSVCSCYKDKGNYDYAEINELEISGGIDSVLACDQMDMLYIPVNLEGTQYSDTSRFTYEWEINKKVVATTKDLRMHANFPLGELPGRYIVTDKELGTKAFKTFKINISSSTAGNGILVLSKYKGHAELSFKRLDKENSTFTPNYYYELAGNYLGTNPRKIHRNYMPEAKYENSGLKIETDGRLRCLDEETLLDVDGSTYLDHNFFINRSMAYPPEVSAFDVQAFTHVIMSTNPMGFAGVYTFAIANDQLWSDQYMSVMGGAYELTIAYVAKPSPLGGKLSPVLFQPYQKPSGAQEYALADFVYMFDETNGKFVYGAIGSPTNTACPDNLGTWEGHRMLYGTHTSTSNYAVAVLSDDAVCRMLYLKLPGKGNESSKYPCTCVADVVVPSDIVHEGTSYYPMKNEPYLLMASGERLYKYNLRSLEAGTAPGAQDAVATLADFGYGDGAEITCMSVSRTEQEVILGVSRYGNDTDGQDDELKGDVLVLDMKTWSLIKKYEGVSGYPVDVTIKYQKFLRDGKENGSTVSDVLYF